MCALHLNFVTLFEWVVMSHLMINLNDVSTYSRGYWAESALIGSPLSRQRLFRVAAVPQNALNKTGYHTWLRSALILRILLLPWGPIKTPLLIPVNCSHYIHCINKCIKILIKRSFVVILDYEIFRIHQSVANTYHKLTCTLKPLSPFLRSGIVVLNGKLVLLSYTVLSYCYASLPCLGRWIFSLLDILLSNIKRRTLPQKTQVSP